MPRTSPFTLDPESLIPADELHTARDSIRRRFLEAVAPVHRTEVQWLLQSPYGDGRGLRAWLEAVVVGRSDLPASIPAEVTQVYIDRPEAMPLHDCASCGFVVPVIPGSEYGYEGDAAQAFFPTCPNCGGRTGWHLFWSQSQPR